MFAKLWETIAIAISEKINTKIERVKIKIERIPIKTNSTGELTQNSMI